MRSCQVDPMEELLLLGRLLVFIQDVLSLDVRQCIIGIIGHRWVGHANSDLQMIYRI